MVKRKKWTFFLLFFSLSLDREKTSFTPPLSLSLLSRFLPFAVKTSNAKRDKERQRAEAAFSSSSGLSRHRKKFNSPSRFCVSCFFLRIALGLFRKWLASGMKKKGAVDTSRYFADEKKEVLEKKKGNTGANQSTLLLLLPLPRHAAAPSSSGPAPGTLPSRPLAPRTRAVPGSEAGRTPRRSPPRRPRRAPRRTRPRRPRRRTTPRRP